MIIENEEYKSEMAKQFVITNFMDDYWIKRFQLVSEHIPLFIKGQEHEVLRSGKYVYVLRECGITEDRPLEHLYLNTVQSQITED
jgi:hypothetical protein